MDTRGQTERWSLCVEFHQLHSMVRNKAAKTAKNSSAATEGGATEAKSHRIKAPLAQRAEIGGLRELELLA